jgi:hypothetical protein
MSISFIHKNNTGGRFKELKLSILYVFFQVKKKGPSCYSAKSGVSNLNIKSIDTSLRNFINGAFQPIYKVT